MCILKELPRLRRKWKRGRQRPALERVGGDVLPAAFLKSVSVTARALVRTEERQTGLGSFRGEQIIRIGTPQLELLGPVTARLGSSCIDLKDSVPRRPAWLTAESADILKRQDWKIGLQFRPLHPLQLNCSPAIMTE